MLLCLQVLVLAGPAADYAQAQERLVQAGAEPANRAQTDRAQTSKHRIEWMLKARPDTCVALHKGQVCFQSVQLSWSGPGNVRLCLFSSLVEQPLHCSTADQATYLHEYQSTSSEQFILRQGESGQVRAKVIVNTAWVYRTGRRSSSSWRLF